MKHTEGEALSPTVKDLHVYLKTKKGKFKEHTLSIDNDIVNMIRYSDNGDTQILQQELNPCHVRLAKRQ